MGAGALAAVASALEVWWLAWPLWAAGVMAAVFFRDPPRSYDGPPGDVLSPADGRVVEVVKTSHPALGPENGWKIAIFMNIFNVHVNRIPVAGQVEDVRYYPGGYMPADRPEAAVANEHLEVIIRTPEGHKVVVVQVAGLVARRIECELLPGDRVVRGERYGMIRLGSRLEVVVPAGSRVVVGEGAKVKAGQSVIAKLAQLLPEG